MKEHDSIRLDEERREPFGRTRRRMADHYFRHNQARCAVCNGWDDLPRRVNADEFVCAYCASEHGIDAKLD